MVREDDDEGYVNVGVQSGNVVLSKRLDYEALNQKVNLYINLYPEEKFKCLTISSSFSFSSFNLKYELWQETTR